MRRKLSSSACALLALTSSAAAYAHPDAGAPDPVVRAAPVAGCTEAAIGPAYDAVVESTTHTECFQFVTEASARSVKLNVVVAGLPADGAHDVLLSDQLGKAARTPFALVSSNACTPSKSVLNARGATSSSGAMIGSASWARRRSAVRSASGRARVIATRGTHTRTKCRPTSMRCSRS